MKRREALAGLAALLSASPAIARQRDVLPWDDLEPLPAGTRARFTDLTRVTGETVPNRDFFVLSHGEVPRIRAAQYRLEVGRRGESGRALGLEEIAGLPRRESVVLFECCGNGGIGMHGLVGAARWGGIPLAPLLEEWIDSESREVVFFGADQAPERVRGNDYPARFARSLPVADALGPEVLLANSMNGEPLPREHGGPLRLIAPGFYGVTQVKWVQRIEIWPERFAGWFQAKDYVTVRGAETPSGVVHAASAIGRMRLKSLVTRVERAQDGRLRIHGLAWSDARTPITGVEIRVDDGPFQAADLLPAAHRFGFRRFSLDWPDSALGDHRLVSRARDSRALQPTQEEASHLKATPWENNGQVVRRIRLR